MRSIIRGPSNCGNPIVMFNLLYDVNVLRFTDLYMFSKSLFQPKYRTMENLKKSLSDERIGYQPYSNNEELPPPGEVDAVSIMVFDDDLIKDNTIYISISLWDGTVVWTLSTCVISTVRCQNSWFATMPTV